MGFSKQEYWSGLPFTPPGDLPDPGIKPTSPALAGEFFITEPPGKSQVEGETRIKKEQNGMVEGGKAGEKSGPRVLIENNPAEPSNIS